jgi:hypothetical protein
MAATIISKPESKAVEIVPTSLVTLIFIAKFEVTPYYIIIKLIGAGKTFLIVSYQSMN